MVTALLAAVLIPSAGGLPPSRVGPPALAWAALLLALSPMTAAGYRPGDQETP